MNNQIKDIIKISINSFLHNNFFKKNQNKRKKYDNLFFKNLKFYNKKRTINLTLKMNLLCVLKFV